MKNAYGWTSEYRRKKFEERYKKRPVPLVEEHRLEPPLELPCISKTIAVMLDIEGTCDGIDDETAKLFVRSLDVIRKKFVANYGTISISTHANNTREMKKILDILARNLVGNIKIGTCFFYGGFYDYASDRETIVNPHFNLDKVVTFATNYVNTLGNTNAWCAIIDDGISDYDINRFETRHPFLIAKPSGDKKDVEKNNFNRIASTTKGFRGVIEIIGAYLKNIEGMTPDEVKSTQESVISHLSSYDLTAKVLKRDYEFLKKYFEGDYADEDDYRDVLDWMILVNRGKHPSKEELVQINEVFRIIGKHFQSKGDKALEEKTISFQKVLESNNL